MHLVFHVSEPLRRTLPARAETTVQEHPSSRFLQVHDCKTKKELFYSSKPSPMKTGISVLQTELNDAHQKISDLRALVQTNLKRLKELRTHRRQLLERFRVAQRLHEQFADDGGLLFSEMTLVDEDDSETALLDYNQLSVPQLTLLLVKKTGHSNNGNKASIVAALGGTPLGAKRKRTSLEIPDPPPQTEEDADWTNCPEPPQEEVDLDQEYNLARRLGMHPPIAAWPLKLTLLDGDRQDVHAAKVKADELLKEYFSDDVLWAFEDYWSETKSVYMFFTRLAPKLFELQTDSKSLRSQLDGFLSAVRDLIIEYKMTMPIVQNSTQQIVSSCYSLARQCIKLEVLTKQIDQVNSPLEDEPEQLPPKKKKKSRKSRKTRRRRAKKKNE